MEYDSSWRTIFFFRESDFFEFGRMIFSSKMAFFSWKMKVAVAVLPLFTRRLTPRSRNHYHLFWFPSQNKGVGT
jgi:hypothetical protein